MRRDRTLEENTHLIACDTQEILRELRNARFKKEEKAENINFWLKFVGFVLLISLASLGLSVLLINIF